MHEQGYVDEFDAIDARAFHLVLYVDGAAAGCWWLRSPGLTRFSAASVDDDGSLYVNTVSNESGSVRPAVWLDLSADLF